jgi:hypothetical protein
MAMKEMRTSGDTFNDNNNMDAAEISGNVEDVNDADDSNKQKVTFGTGEMPNTSMGSGPERTGKD